jgi:uncharacterized membrane protein (UPF0136 family)
MTMAALCGAGGLFGYTRTRSVPSLVAGLGVGALYVRGAAVRWRRTLTSAAGLQRTAHAHRPG